MAGRGTEQSLLEELTCAICCDLFTEPVMLECMHHFCKGCIQAHWQSSQHPPSCPQCRREIPGRTFRTPYLVAGVVEKVRRYGLQEHRRQIQVSHGARPGCCARPVSLPPVSKPGSFSCEIASLSVLCAEGSTGSPVPFLAPGMLQTQVQLLGGCSLSCMAAPAVCVQRRARVC